MEENKKEIKPEDIWNDEKKEGVKKLISEHETLEEAAQKHYPVNEDAPFTERYGLNYAANRGFIKGAKWQAERMYSLEEISEKFMGNGVKGGYVDDWLDYRINNSFTISFKDWFKQFKNK